MRRLMTIERARLSELLGQHDLTIPQFLVMAHLAGETHACLMGTLAKELAQSNATTTGIVRRLEGAHLVRRTRDNLRDRREVSVELTAEGRALLKRARHARRSHIRRAVTRMSGSEARELVRLLDKYLSQLEQER